MKLIKIFFLQYFSDGIGSAAEAQLCDSLV